MIKLAKHPSGLYFSCSPEKTALINHITVNKINVFKSNDML